jgi:predicted enzyme related to lactoylglutathione lyase
VRYRGDVDDEHRAGVLRRVDAVTVPVPDLDAAIAWYGGALGQPLRWRNEDVGQAGLGLAESRTELVLTTRQGYEPNWLLESADAAAEVFRDGGGAVVVEPFDIPVGRVAVVTDPFGNTLVLVDLSTGTYRTDGDGRAVGVDAPSAPGSSPPA